MISLSFIQCIIFISQCIILDIIVQYMLYSRGEGTPSAICIDLIVFMNFNIYQLFSPKDFIQFLYKVNVSQSYLATLKVFSSHGFFITQSTTELSKV